MKTLAPWFRLQLHQVFYFIKSFFFFKEMCLFEIFLCFWKSWWTGLEPVQQWYRTIWSCTGPGSDRLSKYLTTAAKAVRSQLHILDCEPGNFCRQKRNQFYKPLNSEFVPAFLVIVQHLCLSSGPELSTAVLLLVDHVHHLLP